MYLYVLIVLIGNYGGEHGKYYIPAKQQHGSTVIIMLKRTWPQCLQLCLWSCLADSEPQQSFVCEPKQNFLVCVHVCVCMGRAFSDCWCVTALRKRLGMISPSSEGFCSRWLSAWSGWAVILSALMSLTWCYPFPLWGAAEGQSFFILDLVL